MEKAVDLKQKFRNVLMYGYGDLSVENEVFLACFKKGYRDMTTARATFAKIGERFCDKKKPGCEEKSVCKEISVCRDKFYKELADIIKKSLLKKFNSEESFDREHDKCCGKILKKFNKEMNENFPKKTKIEFYYGSAQKLINMTLKYFLLAAEDYTQENKNYNITSYNNIIANEPFLHCPIDSIVIGHIKSDLGEKRKINNEIWSKLRKDEYLLWQENIKKLVGDKSKLYYDFLVWDKKSTD